jgi:hypothetical protein
LNLPEYSTSCCGKIILALLLVATSGASRISYAEDEANDDSTEQGESKPVDSEPANSETVNSEAVNSEPANSEAVDTEPRWKFGSTRIRIGVVKPTFSDELKFYEKLYGKPSNYPTIGFDYSFIRKYVAIGVGMKMAYFTDQGHAAQNSVDNPTDDDISVDTNGPTELTLVPFGAFATMQFTPFPKKYLVLDGYWGFERLYFQEVRVNTGADVESTEAKASSPITVKGSRDSLLVGVAANILLNGIDEQSANSMRGTMGLGSVYLSPFVEVVKGIGGKKGATFDRTNIGIGFTFESIH